MLKPTSPIVRGLNILRRNASRMFFAVWSLVVATPVFSYTRAYARSVHAYRWTSGKKRLLVAAASCVVLLVGLAVNFSAYQPARAAVSDNLNFQARLEKANGAIANDGNYNIRFRLYNASTGGSALWTESYLNSASQGVRVVNGYVSVNLGSVTAFPGNISWDQDMYITMEVGGTSTGTPTWDGEMNPRLKLTAVPYAFQAKSATQLQASDSGNIATLSFTTPTQSNSIVLPNASGTVCLQSNTACGFAASTGATGYIWNGTAQQTANLNVMSANAASVTALIQGASGQTANIFEVRDATGNLSLGVNQLGNTFVGPLSTVGGKLGVSTGTAGARGVIIQGVSGQTGNLFQLQDNGGNVNAAFNGSGAQLTLGRASGTTGQLVLNNSSGVGGITLQGTATAGSYVLNLPAENGTLCSTGSICAGYAAAPSSGSFVELAPTGPQTDSSTNASLAINKTGASGNLLTLQKNGVSVATIGNTGNTLFQNSTNSTTAFQIQNSAGNSNLFVADTTNSRIGIGALPSLTNGGILQVTGNVYASGRISTNTGLYLQGVSSNAGNITKQVVAGAGGVNQYDVVVLEGGSTNRVITSSTPRDPRIYGVVASAAAEAAGTDLVLSGNFTVNVDTGAVAIGDQLVVSSSAGRATVDNNATTGILGYALTSKSAGSNGTVSYMTRTVNGQSSPVFRNTTNSTAAFQIQNAAGNALLNANTTGGQIDVTGTLSVTGTLGSISTSSGGNNLNFSRNGINYVTATNATGSLYLGAGGNSGALRIAPNGSIIAQNATDSTTAFQIQNAAGTSNLLVADTTNSKIGVGIAPNSSLSWTLQTNSGGIYSAGQILAETGVYSNSAFILNGTQTDSGFLMKRTIAGGTVNANDVVVMNSNAQTVATTTARDTRVYGVAGSAATVGNQTPVAIAGNTVVNADATYGAIAIGDQLVTSPTSGRVMIDNGATAGILGYATSALASGTGTIGVRLQVTTGQSSPVFRNTTNSTAAFQIQNATGNSFVTADSTNGSLAVGAGASSASGVVSVQGTSTSTALYVQGGASGSATTAIIRSGNTSSNALDVQGSSGNSIILANGLLLTLNNNNTAGFITNNKGTFLADSGAANQVALKVQGRPSQTANLQEWQDSTGAVFARVNSEGRISSTYGFFAGAAAAPGYQVRITAKAGSGQTADLVQLQNVDGYSIGGFDATGKLQFADGAGAAYDTNLYRSAAGTLRTDNSLSVGGNLSATGAVLFQNSADSTTAFQIQNAAGTSNLLVADTTNNKIGIGTSSSASLGQLQVGAAGSTTAANGITFGQDSIANLYRSSANALRTDGGFFVTGNTQVVGSLQVNSTVGFGLAPVGGQRLTIATGAASNIGLVVQSVVGQSADLLRLQNSTTNVATVGATGATLFQNSTNSTAAFQIQNSAGTSNLLVADTTNNVVGIGTLPTTSGGTTKLDVGGTTRSVDYAIAGISNTSGAYMKGQLIGTGGVNQYDVVILGPDSGAGGATRATTTTTSRDNRIYGVAVASASAESSLWVAISGSYTVNADTAAIAVGDQLITSTTAGRVTADNNATTGILGYATTSKAAGSNGTVGVRIQVATGQYSPTFRNATNSTVAFRIQDAAGTNLFTADTTNGRLAVGPAAVAANGVLTVGTNTGTAAGGLYFGTDTNLYRYATNMLQTDGGLRVGSTLRVQNGVGFGGDNQSGNQLTVFSTAAANRGIVIRGAASQTGDLFQLQNSGANLLTGFDSSGRLQFADGAGGAYDTNLYRSSAGLLQTDSNLVVGGALTTPSSTARLSVTTGATGGRGLVVQAVAGQTTYIAEFQSSTGQIRTWVDASGSLGTQGLYIANASWNTVSGLRIHNGLGTTIGAYIRGASAQTADLLQFQDVNGTVHGGFNGDGSQLTLGRAATSGTVSQGKLVLSDGTTSGYQLTLQAGTLDANQTVIIPTTVGASDQVCLQSLANCTGTGGGIAGSGTQNYLAKFDTAGGNHVGNSIVHDNGTSVSLNTNSTTAFKVEQTGVRNNTLVVDTTNGLVGIGQAPLSSGKSLQVTGGASINGNTDVTGTLGATSTIYANKGLVINNPSLVDPQANISKNYTLTGTVNVSDVVILDNSALLSTTTTARDTRVAGVATYASSYAVVAISGVATVNADTTAVAIGDQLVTSTTAGHVTVDNNATTGILGYATTTKAAGSNGTVGVRIQITAGQYSPVFRNATDSTTAFRVQNAAGTNLLHVDTLNSNVVANGVCVAGWGGVGIGTGCNNSAKLSVATAAVGAQINVVGSTSDILQLQDDGVNVFTVGYNGSTKLQNSIDSTTALQVQNAAGTNLLVVDTTNQRLAVGPAAVPANGILTVGTNTTTAAGGVYFGTDTAIYRNGTSSLRTSGSLSVDGNLILVSCETVTAKLCVNTSGLGANINVSSTNDILNLRTSGTLVTQVTSTGSALFRNASNSSAGFTVQNASSASLLNINTSNGTTSVSGVRSAEVGSWTTGPNLPAVREEHTGAYSNGYLYVLGGSGTYPAASPTNSVAYSAISSTNGSMGAWASATNLPASLFEGAAASHNGYIYYAGGQDGSNSTSAVYYAKQNSNGTLGSWATANALPAARREHTATVVNGYLYIVGGYNTSGVAQSTVYYAKINSDGSLGSWVTGTAMPGARNYHAAATANGYLYIVGGQNTANAATVFYAKPDAATGAISAWTTSANPLPVAYRLGWAATMNNHLYYIGGYDGAGSALVRYASLDALTGANGSWTTNAVNRPTQNWFNNIVAANGYFYETGGGFAINTTRYASLTSLNSSNVIEIQTNGGNVATVNSSGHVVIQNSMDATNSFQIQNASGQSLFVADTFNQRLAVGPGAVPANSILTVGTDDTSTASGGITFGTDISLYRSSSTVLATDKAFSAFNGTVHQVALGRINPGVAGAGITFGGTQDTNLYRSAADTLKTDDNFTVQTATDSATAFQVQDAAGTAALSVDTTALTTAVQAKYDTLSTGANLIATTDFTDVAWTKTGWTVDATTATHNTGNTSVLSTNQVTPVNGTTYQISYTISGSPATNSTLTTSFGGVTLATHTFATTASSSGFTETRLMTASSGSGSLTFTPSTNFNGVISAVEVRIVSQQPTAALVVKNASGAANIEVRPSNSVSNTLVGLNSGSALSAGVQNTAMGSSALQYNTTGSDNAALGYQALQANSTGANNTALGSRALQANTVGRGNTAVGHFVLGNNLTGNYNSALGVNALAANVNGAFNTAIGTSALQATVASINNVAVGSNALNSLSTGGNNTALGVNTLTGLSLGSNNIAIGFNSGSNGGSGNQLSSGSYNTFVGYYSGLANATQISRSTAIGTHAQVGSSDSIILGCVSGVNSCTNTTTVGIGTQYAPNALTVSPGTYNTGTISQTGTTITGSGTTFTGAMTAGTVYYSDGTTAVITAYNTATSLTVSVSKTVTAGATYTIVYGGFNVNSSGVAFLQPTTDTANAFRVLAANSNPILTVDSINQTVALGATASGEAKLYVSTGLVGSRINQIGSNNLLELQTAGTNVLTVGATGNTTLRNSTNSTGAISIQNSNGEALFNVDTTSTNLISNSSFEPNITGWVAKGGASIAQDSSNYYIGNNGLAISTTSAGQGVSFPVVLAPSTTYTLSLMSRLSSGSYLSSIQLGRQDNGSDINCTSAYADTRWNRVSCTFTTGSTIASSKIYLQQNDAVARTIYIDAVQLNANSTSPVYTNGKIQLNGVVSSPLTLQNANNSFRAFQILQANGTDFIVANTSDRSLTLSGRMALYGTIGNVATLSTTALTNDVLVAADSSGFKIGTTTIARHSKVFGVAEYGNPAGSGVEVRRFGYSLVNADATYGPINPGDQLVTSPTAGRVMADNKATTGILGLAKTALASGTGTVTVELMIVGGQDTPRFQNSVDSTTAFQIQNAAGTSNLFNADTTNTRIGIGTATPGYTLDVNGDVNTTGAFRINGVQIASSTLSDTSNLAKLDANQTFTGYNTFRNTADSTTAFQVQNAAGTALLTADTTNSQLSVRGSNSDATLGVELITTTDLTNPAWTSTGWNTTTTTATHNTGNTSALSTGQFSVVAGTTYLISYTVNIPFAGTLTPQIGGVNGTSASNNQGSGSLAVSQIITASTTGSFQLVPNSAFNGTVSAVSVKAIVTSTNNSVLQLQNSSGTTSLEVRASGSTTNAFVGLNAGRANAAGVNGTAFGTGALQSNVTGSDNAAFGYISLQNNINGSRNTAVGSQSLKYNLSGLGNTAVGAQSLQANTYGSFNVGLGDSALFANTLGAYNNAVGYRALVSNTSGSSNVAMGIGALALNTTANNSTALGYLALGQSNAANSVGIGSVAGYSITSGANNTLLGARAGQVDTDGFSTVGTVQNSTALGYSAQVQASNALILGGTGANAVNVGIGTTAPANLLSVSPVLYSTGTASRTNASATVLGTGTTWTSSMVGKEIIFADGFKSTIASVADATTLTMSATATTTDVSPVMYRIHQAALQVTSSGNVGIGTLTPTATLDVAGDALFKNTTDSTAAFRIQNAAGSNLFIADTTNSSIGIGKVPAQGALDVNGSIFASGSLVADGIGGCNLSYKLCIQTAGAGAKINVTASNNILELENTGTDVVTVGYTGSTIFRNSADSTSAFQIQNAAGTSIFNVDTTGGGFTAGTVGVVSNINGTLNVSNGVSTSYVRAGSVYEVSRTTSSDVTSADVLIYDSSGTVTQTTTPRDPRVMGVARSSVSTGQSVVVAISGEATVKVDTGAVNVGDQLVTSGTVNRATVDNNATTGIIGVALASKAAGSNGSVNALIRPVGGQYSPNFRNATDSTTAFQVQTAAGTSALRIDTASNIAYITGILTVGTASSTAKLNVQTAGVGAKINVTGSDDILQLQNNGTGVLTVGSTGSTLFKNSSNSTTALQIQNSSGANLFTVDTTNNRTAIGPSAVPANAALTIGTNTTTADGGTYFGTDTSLYRAGTGVLRTGGSFASSSVMWANYLTANQVALGYINSSTNGPGITFSSAMDTNLYRSAAGVLKTDSSFQVAGTGTSYVMGPLGLGTTNPQAASALTIANGSWMTAVDSTGSGFVNMFKVNANNEIQVGAAMNVDGGIVLPTNGGQLTLVDMPIDATATASTPQSYSFRVGSTNALTVYGQADGAGNSQNLRVAVGSSISPQYTLDVGGDINTSTMYRVGGVQIASTNLSDGSNLAKLNGTQTFTGANTLQNTSTTAFRIQNTGGSTTLFVADTTNSRLAVGPAAVAANAVLTIGTNTTTAAGGIYFGTDTALYRSAANTLTTPGAVVIGGALQVDNITLTGACCGTGINFANKNMVGLNTIQISDSGAGEGFSWADATWSIDNSDLARSNTGANLNLYGTTGNVAIWRPALFVQNATSYATATAGANGSLAFTSTGTGGVSFRNGADSTSALQIQNAAGTGLFTADASNLLIKIGTGTPTLPSTGLGDLFVTGSLEVLGAVLIGTSSNGAMFDGTTHELVFSGTARHARTVTLAPSYAGSAIRGDGSNNTGTMSTSFCSGSSKLNIPASGNPCGANDQRTYYEWTANATNDNDIWVTYKLPTDFSAFDTNAFTFHGWGTTSSETAILTVYNGSTSCGAFTLTGDGSWQSNNITASTINSNCAGLAAGDVLTIDVKLTVGTNGNFARAGEILVNYLSRY